MRFGWAYVNSAITGAVANGPTNSVQFNSGSQVLSGSSNFTFNPVTNLLVVTGTISASAYQGITVIPTPAGLDKQIQFNSGSSLSASSNLTFDYLTNTLYVTGTLRADNLIVSSSQILTSGSTIFGDDISDTHQFTGSILGGIISGTIGQFSTLSASNSLVSNTTTIGNYAQFLPVNTTLPSNITASYIYTSGSTNDLYFQQYDPTTGLTNNTRLRWLEGALGTGLLYGGGLSTVNGTTTFSVAQGDGVIVDFNATTGSDPYPTTTLVQWSNFISQSLTYSGSAQITYVAINSSGNLVQSTIPYTSRDRKQNIVLGRILHQTGSVTNGTISEPNTGYAFVPNARDFYRSFGPLKVSGHTLQTSGSTLGLLKTAGSSYVEGRNYRTDPNSPNFIEATDDPALTNAKIYREYVSGSNYIIDTGIANAGYAVINPTLYNNNGTLTSVSPSSKFTIQRVYWFPNSVNRALFVYYGSQIYDSIASAVDGVTTEAFIEGQNTQTSAIYLGAIIVAGNATDLTDPAEAKIIQAGLFRNVGGGGGGGATTPGGSNTQIQYNDGGAFNGSPNFTFNNVTNNVTITGSLNTTGYAAIGNNILGYGGIKGGYTIFTGSFNVFNNSYFLAISSTGSAITASLENANQYQAGQTLIFKDIGGAAGTNNILIKPSGSQTIDGANGGVNITVNSGSITLVSNGTDQFFIVASR